MTVSHAAGECPRIRFRGHNSLSSPGIYVDGTMMLDTCILDQISTMDIDRAEVYPAGHTPYAGIPYNPFGVILVFRTRE